MLLHTLTKEVRTCTSMYINIHIERESLFFEAMRNYYKLLVHKRVENNRKCQFNLDLLAVRVPETGCV